MSTLSTHILDISTANLGRGRGRFIHNRTGTRLPRAAYQRPRAHRRVRSLSPGRCRPDVVRRSARFSETGRDTIWPARKPSILGWRNGRSNISTCRLVQRSAVVNLPWAVDQLPAS